jgi:hypothetical protein
MGQYSNLFTASDEELNSAKRLSGIINSLVIIHPIDQLIHSWIAVKLADGSTDGVLYDTRQDAVRHQAHEQQCAYLNLGPVMGGMDINAAFAILKFHRDSYDAGYTFIDPEHPTGGMDIGMPIAMEDVRAHVHRMHNKRKKR